MFYFAKIITYDDEDMELNKKAFVIGKDFSSAMENLQKYYGKENIDAIYLTPYGYCLDDTVFELNDDNTFDMNPDLVREEIGF